MYKILQNRNLKFFYIFVFFHYLHTVAGIDYYTEKPSYIKSCRIYEPEFAKCSTESINKLLDQMKIGIPDIKFKTLDPLKLDEIVFKQDNNQAATLRANLSDVYVTGFSKLIAKESRVSKKNFYWETKLFLPKMRIDGKYKMVGKILLIPLSGHGNMFIEIENLDILMHTKTRLYEKGDFTFYNVSNVRVDLNMSGVKTNFDNIFNGNSKEVERQTNELFNQNWRDFFEALRPLISETVERILLDLLQQTFTLIPANFFVEDIPTSEQLYGKKKDK